MKIVISSFTYYPNLDGVQKVTQYQAEGLASLGHDVSVLTIGNDNKNNDEVYNGVRILREDVKSKHGIYYKNVKKYHNQLLDLTSNADFLITVGSLNLVSKVIRDISCKKVLYLHGKPPKKFEFNNFRYGIINGISMFIKVIRSNFEFFRHWKLMKDFDIVTHLFQNDNTYNYFRDKNFKNNIVLENAADDEFFMNKNEENNHFLSKNTILVVGNYCVRKNQIYALEAFYISNVDATITFIGSQNNKYYSKLIAFNHKLEKKYGKSKVNILYGLKREEIYDYYKNAICVLISSYNEYYPVVIVESMASGVPFISTNVGIISKLPGGIIVNSKEEMAYWIKTFTENKEIAKKYGEIAYDYAKENLQIHKQVERLNNALNKSLD
jgi:glycosyltransferase involved in cell wall biosynthesis